MKEQAKNLKEHVAFFQSREHSEKTTSATNSQPSTRQFKKSAKPFKKRPQSVFSGQDDGWEEF